MPRKRLVVDYDHVREAASHGWPAQAVAERIGIARRSLFNLLKRDKEFEEAYQSGYRRFQGILSEAMYRKATGQGVEKDELVINPKLSDTTMLIWLSKNHLGFRDRADVQTRSDGKVTIKVVYEDRKAESGIEAGRAESDAGADGETAIAARKTEAIH